MATRYSTYDTRPSPSPRNSLIPAPRRGLSAAVRKLVDRKPKAPPPLLPVPKDVIADDARKAAGKASRLSALHRRLFQKEKEKVPVKALTEGNRTNTRTLAMVLRSERELIGRNRECEEEILDLQLALQQKNRDVEKLRDLALKQREEIKALKDAVLFPEVMTNQVQLLLEKQGSELKQAKEVIPDLQKQVSSLTGQLMCLAEDLAEVKADKSGGRSCSDGPFSSPRTPIYNRGVLDSLDFDSTQPTDSESLEDMFLRDLNPCLTPCFSKTKSKIRC